MSPQFMVFPYKRSTAQECQVWFHGQSLGRSKLPSVGSQCRHRSTTTTTVATPTSRRRRSFIQNANISLLTPIHPGPK